MRVLLFLCVFLRQLLRLYHKAPGAEALCLPRLCVPGVHAEGGRGRRVGFPSHLPSPPHSPSVSLRLEALITWPSFLS